MENIFSALNVTCFWTRHTPALSEMEKHFAKKIMSGKKFANLQKKHCKQFAISAELSILKELLVST